MLDKQQAQSLVDRVVRASRADEVCAAISWEDTTHLRFARNSPSTSGSVNDTELSIRSVFGRRSGAVAINQFDDASVRRAVELSEEIARLAPEDPEHLPAEGPHNYPSIDAYHSSVVDGGAAQIAAGARTCIDAARNKGLVAAGFVEAGAKVQAIGNSAGLFGYHRSSDVSLSQTVRTADGQGSGWSSAVGNRVADIDFASKAAVAIDKAMRSVDPKPLSPGKYVTILEPVCVANMVSLLLQGMSARAADEGRSFFSAGEGGNRIGESLFPDVISIYSDPADPMAPGAPWLFGRGWEFVPQTRRSWIDKGVVANLVYDRFWAQKSKRSPMPAPSNLIMSGGEATLDELIASTKRGVLVTSLWYIRSVDPRTMLHTGLTRDGVYWIENGEISHPITNFRWNDSPVRVLKNVEAMTRPVRVSPRPEQWTSMAVPALKVKEFELSSVSEAV